MVKINKSKLKEALKMLKNHNSKLEEAVKMLKINKSKPKEAVKMLKINKSKPKETVKFVTIDNKKGKEFKNCKDFVCKVPFCVMLMIKCDMLEDFKPQTSGIFLNKIKVMGEENKLKFRYLGVAVCSILVKNLYIKNSNIDIGRYAEYKVFEILPSEKKNKKNMQLRNKRWIKLRSSIRKNIKNFDGHSFRKSCANCNESGRKFKFCSNCKMAYYCSKECQVEHWKKHKLRCNL